MSDVTKILSQIESGDATNSEKLLPLVYDQLRELAAARMYAERSDHTLQATALVHEAYLRLVGAKNPPSWDSRRHFFAAAAEAMRRILVESARSKKSLKRGGDRRQLELLDCAECGMGRPDLFLDIEEGLIRLEREDATAAELVKLRLFAGLSITEAGEALGLSRSTAYENWDFARSWLALHVEKPGKDGK